MKHVYRLHYVLALLMLMAVSCLRLSAQATTDQVSGTVVDASGAVVPDADVQITNTDTAAVRTTQTNDKGEYNLPSLAIGPYSLQVTKTGFETYVQRGIVLELGNNPSIKVALKIGSTATTVQVESNAAQVETQNPSVNQVIDTAQVVDLPLNGREVTDLIALTGAAVVDSGPSDLDYPGSVSYSVAGSQGTSTNYALDGAQHEDYRLNVGLPMPFPDALAEFSVGISAMPANLGIHSGGMVSGSTKSGTNSFHGGLFEFVRNGFFDATARTYPNIRSIQGVTPVCTNGFVTGSTTTPCTITETAGTKDTLQRNQFGGEIGGPIKKDKLFFFGGYQGTMNNSTVGASTTTLPTPAMMTGDFSALGSTNGSTNGTTNAHGCTTEIINAPYTGTTVNGQGLYTGIYNNSNVLNPALLLSTASTSAAQNQTVIHNIENLWPSNLIDTTGGPGYVPSGDGTLCGSYHYQAAPTYVFEGQYVGRVDWNRTKNDTIFGSYFLANSTEPSYASPTNILINQGVGDKDRQQTLALGDTLLMGAHAINTVRLAFDRTASARASNPDIPTLCSMGVNGYCPGPNQFSLLISKPGNLGYDYENSYSGTEGWAWTNGVHQVNIGFTMMHVQFNADGTFQVNPSESAGSLSSGSSFTDFMVGNLSGVSQGGGQIARDGQNQPSAYIQDAYKILPRLQITAGLRWDPYFDQHNKYGMASNFSAPDYIANTGYSTEFPNMPPGVTFPGDQGMHGTSDGINRLNQFAPRAGFVWDVNGNGKETLRGGYGIFFDGSILWNNEHVVLNPPWGSTISIATLPAWTFVGTTPTSTGYGFANPYFGNTPNLPTIAPSHSYVPITGSAWVFQGKLNKAATVQQWDLAFQRQLNKSLLFSATYIGNKTSHVNIGITQNPTLFLNPEDPNPNVTWTGSGSSAIGSGSTRDPTNQTSSPCTIQYNKGTPQAPNIVGLNFAVCNPHSGATSTTVTEDSTKTITNGNARKALNLENPLWGAVMQGGVTTLTNWGDGFYSGLLVSLQQRLAHNFSVLGNYTWSHCMDDGETGQDVGNAASDPLNPKTTSWGNCGTNRKGILNLTLQAQSPRMNERLANDIVHGWNGSGIFTWSTGSYFNISSGYDSHLNGYTDSGLAVQIANPKVAGPVSANTEVVGCGANSPAVYNTATPPVATTPAGSTGSAPGSVGNINYYFNPCAFEPAPLGSASTQVRNSYVGPSNWNGLNLALWRHFTLPERVGLDFRVEAFNVTNHPGLGNPGTTINTSSTASALNSNGTVPAGFLPSESVLSSSSGFINGGHNTYRIMQFAIKANF